MGHDAYCIRVSGEPEERDRPCDCRRGAVDVLRAALTSEDEIAHGEAVFDHHGETIRTGECAYDDEPWPCRTQRGIDRLTRALNSPDDAADRLDPGYTDG